MPPGIRPRLALLALVGVLLIPVGLSSLRGLTHILACEAEFSTPFTFVVPDEGPPQILSSMVLDAGDEKGVCGGLRTDVSVAPSEGESAAMTFTVSNGTAYAWHGTVRLQLPGAGVPIDIDRIAPGASASDTVRVRLEPGTHQVEGHLLVGP